MREKNSRDRGTGTKRSGARRDNGQAMLELVLVLPILLMLTLGVIEFGRAAYYDIAVADAARAGAQYASQSMANAYDQGSITQAALNNSQLDTGPGLTVQPPAVTCACPGGGVSGSCPASGCAYPVVYVTVSANYTLNPLFTYPGISSTFILNSSSTLPVQRQ